MSNLVSVERHMITTDSQVIAKVLGLKHAYVMRVVDTLLDDYPDLRVIQNHPKQGQEYIRLEEREYRGTKFTAAVMNRECFSLLFMRFETKQAREMQRKFNAAFYEMERALALEIQHTKDPDWLHARAQSKAIRIGATDVIKDFVAYATDQGSQSAQYYYKHTTMATYRALQLLEAKKPKVRDTLDVLALAHLMAAEGLVQRRMRAYMDEGEHYKVIFEKLKQDLERFAEGLCMPRPKEIK